jgi:hypothetical protein
LNSFGTKSSITPGVALDLDYSGFVFWSLWVIGANMQSKRFVTLRLKVPHHFIERFAVGRAGRVEDPGAL